MLLKFIKSEYTLYYPGTAQPLTHNSNSYLTLLFTHLVFELDLWWPSMIPFPNHQVNTGISSTKNFDTFIYFNQTRNPIVGGSKADDYQAKLDIQPSRSLPCQLLQLQLSSSNKMRYQLLPGPIRRQGCSVALHNSWLMLYPLLLHPCPAQLIIYLYFFI